VPRVLGEIGQGKIIDKIRGRVQRFRDRVRSRMERFRSRFR